MNASFNRSLRILQLVILEHLILDFSNLLSDGDYVCTVRKTRGEDIDAACGQLANKG